jgi:SynChlorMet cassette radical SAM/SPASM protein ScmE
MKLMRSPRRLTIDITSRCNLRCSYCYHFSGPGDVPEDLPTEEWLRFFEELRECAVMNIAIAGGEPFYREDLKEIIESVVRNKMRYDIASNGTLITKEIAEFLASTKRCDGVQISIDGSTPTIHESCRGSGTFHRALKGISNLKESGITTTVRVTIHKHNLYDLENIAKLLLDDLNLPFFSTNSANYSGLCKKNADHILLTPEERSIAIEVLQKLNRKYNGRIWADAGPLREGQIWQKMESSHLSCLPELPGGGNLAFCNNIMKEMAVRADGTMTPCSQLNHIDLGKINRDSLLNVWQNHLELKRLRERSNILLKDFQFCQDCVYIKFCNGGCPASAYQLVGEENHPSPDLCFKRFLKEGGRLPSTNLSQCDST